MLASQPMMGDLLVYPSFTIVAGDGTHHNFIGHVGIVVGTSHVADWNPLQPRYDLLDVAQCHGPNGFTPGVVRTDGSIWSHHSAVWPKPEHRSWMIRALP
ncbi:MAG: hypothetical protein H0X39_16730 [Actinobacteria bacterium]|nr:hypothetical protein [Actinomycetota bacterium]